MATVKEKAAALNLCTIYSPANKPPGNDGLRGLRFRSGEEVVSGWFVCKKGEENLASVEEKGAQRQRWREKLSTRLLTRLFLSPQTEEITAEKVVCPISLFLPFIDNSQQQGHC